MEEGINMHILVISEVFWPEDFIINDLAREWVKDGHEVDVVTQYPSYPFSYVFDGYENKGYYTEDWEGVKIHRYPFIEGYRDSKIKKFANYYSFVNGGKKVINQLESTFDCIFVSQTGPLTVALPAIYAKKKMNIPTNIWTCDIWPDVVWSYGMPKNLITNALLERLIRKIYSGCDRIFISSKRFAETIGKYTQKECIYTPNWLKPVEGVKSGLILPSDKFNFTFTGNVSRYQNLINTIKGFHKAKIANSQLNIVGEGSYLTKVKDCAKQLGATNVVFHGRRPYKEMFDILLQSQVLVLPLISQEGIEKTEPYKIQSYLQAGKPIFGVLNGSGRDIIEEHQLGLCASPTDIDEIAFGFKRMTEFSNLHANTVKKAALELMGGRFNKKEIVKRITENLVTKQSVLL